MIPLEAVVFYSHRNHKTHSCPSAFKGGITDDVILTQCFLQGSKCTTLTLDFLYFFFHMVKKTPVKAGASSGE